MDDRLLAQTMAQCMAYLDACAILRERSLLPFRFLNHQAYPLSRSTVNSIHLSEITSTNDRFCYAMSISNGH